MIYIGIAAYSGNPPRNAIENINKFVDMFLSLCRDVVDDVVFVVGGYEGLMKVFVDKALERNLKVVILLPIEWENKASPEKAIAIRTGTTFSVRSSILVHTSDIVLALGGGIGSLEEIVTAHGEGKPVYVLVGVGLPTDLVKTFPRKLDERVQEVLKIVGGPEELAEEICKQAKALRTQKS